MTATEPQVDGRHARRDRNRTAVVEAMLELYHEGSYEPSSDEIAARAGLSPRSLFRYFDDLDDLVRTAIAHQLEVVRPLTETGITADAPLADRVARLVQSRWRTYAEIDVVARIARARALTQPLLAEQIASARRFWRQQLADLFAAELQHTPADTLSALDAISSFEAVQVMRDHGLSRSRVEATLTLAITRLLETP